MCARRRRMWLEQASPKCDRGRIDHLMREVLCFTVVSEQMAHSLRSVVYMIPIYISIKTDLRGRAIYMLKITDWNQYHYEVTAIEGKSKGSKTQQTISFAWHMLFHGQDKDPLASVEDGNCPHPMAVFSQWIYLPLECFWSKDSI